jgi:hypothetical protein
VNVQEGHLECAGQVRWKRRGQVSKQERLILGEFEGLHGEVRGDDEGLVV